MLCEVRDWVTLRCRRYMYVVRHCGNNSIFAVHMYRTRLLTISFHLAAFRIDYMFVTDTLIWCQAAWPGVIAVIDVYHEAMERLMSYTDAGHCALVVVCIN